MHTKERLFNNIFLWHYAWAEVSIIIPLKYGLRMCSVNELSHELSIWIFFFDKLNLPSLPDLTYCQRNQPSSKSLKKLILLSKMRRLITRLTEDLSALGWVFDATRKRIDKCLRSGVLTKSRISLSLYHSSFCLHLFNFHECHKNKITEKRSWQCGRELTEGDNDR